MRKRSVALIGMPGCGKTNVGQALAARLRLSWLDIDTEIEKRERLSVSEIFARRGEAYFRARECEAVRRSVAQPAVISCGGGTVLREENARLLKSRCVVVYLCASVQTLLSRVHGGEGRPLLKGDARNKLETLFAERAGVYENTADYTLYTDGKEIDEVADSICKLLAEQGWTI